MGATIWICTLEERNDELHHVSASSTWRFE